MKGNQQRQIALDEIKIHTDELNELADSKYSSTANIDFSNAMSAHAAISQFANSLGLISDAESETYCDIRESAYIKFYGNKRSI